MRGRCRSLAVVVPTISGRESSLALTLAAYEATLERSYELIVVKDEHSWPHACNLGFQQTKADVILFGADDLEPLPGWWETAQRALRLRDELPAPRIMRPEGIFDNAADGPDKALVWFTRVPIMRRDQYRRIGPWPDITYFADVWVSERAGRLGINTRILYGYAFLHRRSEVGRVDTPENMTRARREFNRLVREMS